MTPGNDSSHLIRGVCVGEQDPSINQRQQIWVCKSVVSSVVLLTLHGSVSRKGDNMKKTGSLNINMEGGTQVWKVGLGEQHPPPRHLYTC